MWNTDCCQWILLFKTLLKVMVMKIKVSKIARYVAVVVFIIKVPEMSCFPGLFKIISL